MSNPLIHPVVVEFDEGNELECEYLQCNSYPNDSCGSRVTPRKHGGSATYPTKFNLRWKLKYPYIREVKENRHLFMCTVCNKVLSCSHQGFADVKRHVNSRGHYDRVLGLGSGQIHYATHVETNGILNLANGNEGSNFNHSMKENDNNQSCNQQSDIIVKTDDCEAGSTSKTTGTRENGDGDDKLIAKVKKREDYLQWSDYFMAIAFLSAMRSKDPNSQVGACIVNPENKIVGIGYNGMPNRCSDDELPWNREGSNPLDTKYMYVCHAEMNAIMNKNSSEVKGSTLYVALFPCNECAKLIIQSGIREVVFLSDKYHSDPKVVASRRLLDMAGVAYRQHVPKNSKIVIDFAALNNGTT